jgi:hypothetical protein
MSEAALQGVCVFSEIDWRRDFIISNRKSVYNIELSLPTTVRCDPRVSNAPASFSAFERRRDP